MSMLSIIALASLFSLTVTCVIFSANRGCSDDRETQR